MSRTPAAEVPRVTVIGAGVAGLASAIELAERGVPVEIVDHGAGFGERAASWYAGGMLAPWCERESTEPAVTTLGELALDWWPRHFPETVRNGTLVVAPPRDTAELARFARRTERCERIGENRIAELEPDLAGRFQTALFFADEGHLDPRKALAALVARLTELGVPIRFDVEASEIAARNGADRIVDCRGMGAADELPELRGVRGEMLLIRSHEVRLSRPIRLLHPRFPVYIVPREDGLYMVGATMIESAETRPPSVRSVVELLNAAYAVHPAFGEAEIIEIGVGVRPAFPDNLPHLVESGRTIHFNGLHRHGFLLSPALARELADRILQPLPMETRP